MGLVGELVEDEGDDHQRPQEADEDDASDKGEHLRLLTKRTWCKTGAKLVGYFWSSATIGAESAGRNILQNESSTNSR